MHSGDHVITHDTNYTYSRPQLFSCESTQQLPSRGIEHRAPGGRLLHDQPEWLLWALSYASCNTQDAAPNADILRLRFNFLSAPSPPCPMYVLLAGRAKLSSLCGASILKGVLPPYSGLLLA